jgi:hypothetical protein
VRNHYNPATREIVLAPSASLYSRFHELAHKDQHESNSTVYIAWVILRRARAINYFVTLWIEFDAYRRTRRVMRRLGLWSDEVRQEARSYLRAYALRKAQRELISLTMAAFAKIGRADGHCTRSTSAGR